MFSFVQNIHICFVLWVGFWKICSVDFIKWFFRLDQIAIAIFQSLTRVLIKGEQSSEFYETLFELEKNIFLVWRTQITKKKSDAIFRHPLKNQYKKIKITLISFFFFFFVLTFLRGVGIWCRFFLLFVFFRPNIWSFFFFF